MVELTPQQIDQELTEWEDKQKCVGCHDGIICAHPCLTDPVKGMPIKCTIHAEQIDCEDCEYHSEHSPCNGTGNITCDGSGGGLCTVNTAGTHTQLDKMLWGTFTMVLVDHVLGFLAEGGEFIEFTTDGLISNGTMLGIAMLVPIVIVWAVAAYTPLGKKIGL